MFIHQKNKVTLGSYIKTFRTNRYDFLPLPIGLIRPPLPLVGLRTIIGLTLCTGLNGSRWLELSLEDPELRLPLPWLPLLRPLPRPLTNPEALKGLSRAYTGEMCSSKPSVKPDTSESMDEERPRPPRREPGVLPTWCSCGKVKLVKALA